MNDDISIVINIHVFYRPISEDITSSLMLSKHSTAVFPKHKAMPN